MSHTDQLRITVTPYTESANASFDFDRILFDLQQQEALLSSNADAIDCWVSIASGVLCGTLDVFWVGEFNLENGRNFSSQQMDRFIVKTAHYLGCTSDDCAAAVRFLEQKFPIPSDGCTPFFGGGRQHHLRDFAHHPTIIGLVFSLLTQFTYQCYGTDTAGNFTVTPVPEQSRICIGKDVPQKILYGTLVWFTHLVSDMAGSSKTIGKSGGTGIPGPLLSLAKELSALPLFHNLSANGDPASVILSKLFNGTLLAKHDASGKIIPDSALRFDLRTELGIGVELGKQALPVVANECLVRAFYFVRRLASAVKENKIQSLAELRTLSWESVQPAGNPTIDRMLLISCGVFSTIDLAAAAASSDFIISVNYIGIGRFAVAIGKDVSWNLKRRNIVKLREMYEHLTYSTFRFQDNVLYGQMRGNSGADPFGLTLTQIKFLYNLEYWKTVNDIESTHLPVNENPIKSLKREWLNEWKDAITNGFETFVNIEGAEMTWYTKDELLTKIEADFPSGTWFRLMLLEAMLFEPYYALSTEENKKGETVPSSKYNDLQKPFARFDSEHGNQFLDVLFAGNPYYPAGYIKRLRKTHNKVLRELNESVKNTAKNVALLAAVVIPATLLAHAFAPTIAVALVGANFAGLHGAALTSACLAYLGGGAIAVGGAGMAGGTIAIVGGGAVLGLGAGVGLNGIVGTFTSDGKNAVILQSAKLLVALREIFLNDEHDCAFADMVYQQYVNNTLLLELEIERQTEKSKDATPEDNKRLKKEIKVAKETVNVMKLAQKDFNKFKSSFEIGANHAALSEENPTA